MHQRIYLDNNATTFLDGKVKEDLIHHLEITQGNPSSIHRDGQEARTILHKARRDIAEVLHVKPNEIIFTSGATEGLNAVLRGALIDQGHLITSSVEHAAVYATAKELEERGCSVTFLDPGEWGAVTVEAVKSVLRPDTRLIALMAVNNETGVKTDIFQIAALALEAKVPFLVDGVGLIGKENFEIPAGVSAFCCSGHKFHGPKGVGFTFMRKTFRVPPLQRGGEQEFGLRGGTENLPAIAALAKAVTLLPSELPAATERMGYLRDKLENELITRLSGVTVNGKGPRVVNTSNLSFEGMEGETLLTRLDMEGVAVSHGSACASGALEPSRILLNMGLSRRRAASAIRFSLSRFTTETEIERTIDLICNMSP